MKKTGSEYGFTLIEVMVAMMVMAICLTLIMELFSGGLRSKARAWEYNIAVAQAENILTNFLNAPALESDTDSGKFENGNNWEATISQWDQGDLDPADRLNISGLFKIVVTIKWISGGKERNYSLETLLQG